MGAYKVGFFNNPGYDERGNQSYCHRDICTLEIGEGKQPTKKAIWEKYPWLKDCTYWNGKKKVRLKSKDLFIVGPDHYLFKEMFKILFV